MTAAAVRVIVQTEPALRPWRCPRCNAMLARLALRPGSVVEIKCARCNAVAIKEAA